MRVMLGIDGKPDLLVETSNYDTTRFNFWVVNGAWDGVYNDGHISTNKHSFGDVSVLEQFEILSVDQNRLRGNYQDVFDNFHNVNYFVPEPAANPYPMCWDDDIPF